MAAPPHDPTFTSFKGGLNTSDPPINVREDQVTDVENVEFYESPLGDRRNGGQMILTAGSGLW